MTLHMVYIERARYLVKIGRTNEALTFLDETVAASRFGCRIGAELRDELTAEPPPTPADEQETAIPDSEAGDRRTPSIIRFRCVLDHKAGLQPGDFRCQTG